MLTKGDKKAIDTHHWPYALRMAKDILKVVPDINRGQPQLQHLQAHASQRTRSTGTTSDAQFMSSSIPYKQETRSTNGQKDEEQEYIWVSHHNKQGQLHWSYHTTQD